MSVRIVRILVRYGTSTGTSTVQFGYDITGIVQVHVPYFYYTNNPNVRTIHR